VVIDEPIDGDVFLACVLQVLVSTFSPGEIVILDNLGSHKVPGVQEAIQCAAAIALCMAPYSPGLNPIESIFAKFKALLRNQDRRRDKKTPERLNEMGKRLAAYGDLASIHMEYKPARRVVFGSR